MDVWMDGRVGIWASHGGEGSGIGWYIISLRTSGSWGGGVGNGIREQSLLVLAFVRGV